MTPTLSHAYAVIMAGGRGERFWPLSTAAHPKQFLTLFGGRALLTQAVVRPSLIRFWALMSPEALNQLHSSLAQFR